MQLFEGVIIDARETMKLNISNLQMLGFKIWCRDKLKLIIMKRYREPTDIKVCNVSEAYYYIFNTVDPQFVSEDEICFARKKLNWAVKVRE